MAMTMNAPAETARRDAPLTIYVTPETKAALIERARQDDRTISTTAARILRDALRGDA